MLMLSRTACEVLEEIRKLDETKNYSYLLGLIEELQSMCNRMEAGLSRKRNKINDLNEKLEELKEKNNEK